MVCCNNFFVIFAVLNFNGMPKLKTNSSAKKRFRLTASGKIKRKKAYKRHILTKKAKDRKRRLGHDALVHKADMKNVKLMLNLA